MWATPKVMHVLRRHRHGSITGFIPVTAIGANTKPGWQVLLYKGILSHTLGGNHLSVGKYMLMETTLTSSTSKGNCNAKIG